MSVWDISFVRILRTGCWVTALLIPSVQVCLGALLVAQFGQRFTTLLSQPTQRRPLQVQFEERYTKGLLNSHVGTGKAYRDAAGKIRKDYRRGILLQPVLNVIFIHDPSTHAAYVLDTDARTLLTTKLPDESDNGKALRTDYVPKQREDLGERQMEGVICRGFRFKNDDVVVEVWIAPDLNDEIVLETKSRDDEQLTYRLFDIRHIEPAASLFSIPRDYKELNKEQ